MHGFQRRSRQTSGLVQKLFASQSTEAVPGKISHSLVLARRQQLQLEQRHHLLRLVQKHSKSERPVM